MCAWQRYAQNGFHPTFFYEAIWNVIGFGLLLFDGWRFKRWLRDGDIFFMYMLWYPVVPPGWRCSGRTPGGWCGPPRSGSRTRRVCGPAPGVDREPSLLAGWS